jgi:hypothetical protein
MNTQRAALGALLLLLAIPAYPCSVCSAGDPLVAASDAPSESGELRFTLDGEWLTAEAASDALPGVRDRLTQQTLRLGGVYGPIERLNLALSVPFVQKVLGEEGNGASDRTARVGLGDVELGARWFGWRSTDWGIGRRQTLALSLGSSLPTGEADAREAGLRLDDHAQLGTGGWGPYAGVLYRLEGLTWHGFASVTGRWRTENRFGFRYGAAVTWSVQAQWQPHDRIGLGLGLDGRQAAPDEEDGVVVENTGGFLLAAAPGAWFGVTDDLWVSVRAQLPIASALNGDQQVGPVAVAGLQWKAR